MAVASPAAAAQLLDGGNTAYLNFKIPIPTNSESACNSEADSSFAHELCKLRLIIRDEIVITHRQNLEAVSRTFCDIRRSTLLFGGVVIFLLWLFLADSINCASVKPIAGVQCMLQTFATLFFIQVLTFQGERATSSCLQGSQRDT